MARRGPLAVALRGRKKGPFDTASEAPLQQGPANFEFVPSHSSFPGSQTTVASLWLDADPQRDSIISKELAFIKPTFLHFFETF